MNRRSMVDINKKVYWLLDSRFDFLLGLFMRQFGVERQDIILINSYHTKAREQYNKMYIPYERKDTVVLMEPDDINRSFSKILCLDELNLIISLSGTGLPQSENIISLTATGSAADKCNDKWWQFCCLKNCHILTPYTYQYHRLEALQACLGFLLLKYGKVVIKKPCLSGGYQMKVLSCEKDLENYRISLKNRDSDQDFLVSEYIPHRQSFAAMGIVRRDKTVFFIDAITEQILYREVVYEGLIFPAFLDDGYKDEIRCVTEKIGKILGENGYYGFYNVDFILSENCKLYVAEINARLGFGAILAACLYGDRFWELLQGLCMEQVEYPKKRLVLGKVKAREGRVYSDLKSYSNIIEWFQKGDGFFRTFYCGIDKPEKFEYGSFIGEFGMFFNDERTREDILNMFWEKCIKYYKKERSGNGKWAERN